MKCSGSSPSRFIVAIVAALAVRAGSAQAVELFKDTFDRPDNRNIDASLTGITDNTGTSLAIDGVYTQPFVDPANEDTGQDGDAVNGGGAQIISNTLQLAVGSGTSNAYVNHNFINPDILSAGAFTVWLDVLDGYAGTSAGQGGAFGIGMSQAEADSAGDANGSGSGGNAFQGAFNNANTNSVSDFWVGLRGDGMVAWGTSGINSTINTVPVGQKFGTISANFGVSSFGAGASVNYEVFFNGDSIGVGSFPWSEANTNYIGLDARSGSAVGLDNFLIETSTPPLLPAVTVDRDTGNITLTNQTSQPLSMTIYSLTSASGGFDQSQWDTIESQGLDTNDTWLKLTNPSNTITSDLSEATLGEYSLGSTGSATDTINLGNAWIPSPFEDISVELRDTAGNDVPILVNYVGNGGVPIRLADYNFNGTVDAGDWPNVRDHLISDVSSLPAIQAYLSGDLNGDGMVDRADFRQFKNLFEADNGPGSFAAMAGVPEPSTVFLLAAGLGGVMVAMRTGIRQVASAAVLLFVLLMAGVPDATAANLFTDTFDRADSRNIDASLTGLSNNTGTPLGVDGVYSQPFLDPANDPGPQDGDATNGGGAQILSNELQLAVGSGTSNAFVNHNFTNASILSDGGFRISLDILGFGGTSTGQGGAFALGMAQADALLAGDAFNADPNNVKFTNAFENEFTTVVSDFWVGLRGNATLAWGNGPVGTSDPAFHSLPVASKTGTISATFAPAGFNAGDSVAYEVFYNGTSQGFGAFTWSEDMTNYIGIDGRDGTAVQFDNFIVETVTNPAVKVLRLRVNTDTGVVSIAGGDVANQLDFYQIQSEGLGLVSGNYTGLSGAAGFPSGNGTGNGWELNGFQTSSLVSESYLQSSSTIAAGASGVSLGTIYNTAINSHDLKFSYDLPDGTTQTGFVEYVTGGSTPGDFDTDGDVDGRDFLVWQRNPTVGSLSNWQNNFGIGTVVAIAVVPEPSSCALALSLLTWLWGRRRN